MKQFFLLLLLAFAACQNNHQIVKVNDTDFSKGRLGNIGSIELQDVAKFHGHLCDGLVVGWLGLNEALKTLYPEGVIDRTNTRIVSKPSPCLTDVAVYLTGARFQFNTFYVSKEISGLFVIQRIDDSKAVSVSLKKGVKPLEIDQLGTLAEEGKLDPCELDKLKKLEDTFLKTLLKANPSDIFEIQEIFDFEWKPELKSDYVKTDILNKARPECNENIKLQTLLDPKAFQKQLRKSKKGVLIDVRTPEEYAEGHIRNATNLDYLDDSFEPQADKLDRSKTYFLYCRSGNRTKGAASVMASLGFKNIFILDGGILAWQKENKTLVQ